jgi:putative toxin-antitoxin system antitoxin component (TIGR02293 family)
MKALQTQLWYADPMKAHAASAPLSKASSVTTRLPPSTALLMAKKFEKVFETAFVRNAKVAGRSALGGTGKSLFVTLKSHEGPTLNRDAAAFWASQSVPATAVNGWYVAAGLEKKKDLFAALQLSASTLSRAKPDTTLDAGVTERMLRLSELFVRAAELFGEDGAVWMTTPHDLLDGKSPMQYASNEFGGAKVRQMLNAIEYGGVV